MGGVASPAQYSATAPRSVRDGWQFRGSRGGSLNSPRATHGYYIDRSAVAELTELAVPSRAV